LQLSDVLLPHTFEVAERYQVVGTPTGVLVTADGRIGSHLAAGETAIAELITEAISDSAELRSKSPIGAIVPETAPEGETTSRLGDPVPSVTIAAVDGRRANLADHLDPDGDTVLVFWNPYCHHCQRMLPILRTLVDEPAADAPRVVLLSAGPAEAIHAEIRATILLDDGFAVAQLFAAPGTPSAVLVNKQGQVASAVAAGADAVLDLARHEARLPLVNVGSQRAG
jgi:thiol-disulfide isomerase/thioredoxin